MFQDLLCLEALICNTSGDYDRAMKLLSQGLFTNNSHHGCRKLRAAMKNQSRAVSYQGISLCR